jgi:hypothetical protein
MPLAGPEVHGWIEVAHRNQQISQRIPFPFLRIGLTSAR